MTLLEPALSLPSLLSTSALLGPDDDEADGLEQDVDFTPTAAKRRDSHANLNEDEEEDVFGDDPPSMTLREILLNADSDIGHFHLLGLLLQFLLLNSNFFLMMCMCFVDEDEEDAELDGNDTSFVWE